ncbi:hypothetical protein M422DRAFT_257929 [Sphaerobolus stellatus SS14]|uniref:Uncharacterized protein n=1 Tax=Sphaerobolus stellatus (strain SS14) TaxID=990650 RepID=A0A0C9VNJ3_SPHS4|nr:hypothetical protein M422DRAFT_257929 [Sphaerobolus stellatus SS14]
MPGQTPAHLGLRLPQTDKEQLPSKPGPSCFHRARKSRIQGNPAPRTGSDTTGSAGQPTARHTPLVIDPPQQPDGTQPVNNLAPLNKPKYKLRFSGYKQCSIASLQRSSHRDETSLH